MEKLKVVVIDNIIMFKSSFVQRLFLLLFLIKKLIFGF